MNLLEIKLPRDYVAKLQRGTRAITHYLAKEWTRPRYMTRDDAWNAYTRIIATTKDAARGFAGDVLNTNVARYVFAILRRLETRYDLVELASLKQITVAFASRFGQERSKEYDGLIQELYNALND